MLTRNLLVIILVVISSFSANAGWFNDQKAKIQNKFEEKLKDRVREKLDKYCFKLPIINYYLCPPVSPDWIDKI